MYSATILLARRSWSSGEDSSPCRSIMQTLSRSPVPARVLVSSHGNGWTDRQAAAMEIAGPVLAHVDDDRLRPQRVICWSAESRPSESANSFNSRTLPWTKSISGSRRRTAFLRRAIAAASAEPHCGSQLMSSEVDSPRCRGAQQVFDCRQPASVPRTTRRPEAGARRRGASADRHPTLPASSCWAGN